jgi:hypothetical protein
MRSATASVRLTQDDIIHALRHFGFTEIEQGFVDRDHFHGPASALVAQKPADRWYVDR